jgi:TonB family protein
MRYSSSIIVVAVMIAAGAVFALAQENAPKIIRGGVLNGKAISLPKPAYPEDAKAAGIGGIVRVEIVIDENGNVESAKAVKDNVSSTDLSTETVDTKASLREAAEQAALKARFSPTLLSGMPVKVAGVITYNFVNGSKSDDEQKEINGGILNGKAIELPNAEYPEAAKAVRAQGVVTVQVTIDEGGNVISASAVSGHPLLQSAAVAAAREAKFAPTRLEGAPVKVTGLISYNFVLSEKP